SSLAQPTFAAYFDFAGHSNLTTLIGTVAALNNIGGFIGNFVMSFAADRFGRKKALAACAIISVIGQVLSGGCAPNWGMLMFARFVTGFGGCKTDCLCPLPVSDMQ
ncbi:hypothetical protein CALVIDRAFT_489136, partial [Calocera viscosa TUFC12733]